MSERKYYVLCGSNCRYESMTKEQILTAIQQAVSTGEIADVDTGFITTIKEQNRGNALTFWVGTTAQYNAIEEKAEDCFYILTDDTKDADTAAAIDGLRTEIKSILTLVNNQAPYIVTFSGRISPDSADKTFDEIYNAILEGKRVVGRFPWGSGYEYYQLTRYTNTVLSFAHTNNMSYGSILTDQYKTHLVQMNSDGTFKHYEFKAPQKPENYEEYAYNIFNLGNNTDAWQIDDVSYCYRHGNTIFVDFTITVIDDSVKTIEAKGTQSNLRGLQVPPIYINSDFAPIHANVGSIQLYARCKDVDNKNNETTSMHALPAYITEMGDSYAIWVDAADIMSPSATEVEGFTVRGWWIVAE